MAFTNSTWPQFEVVFITSVDKQLAILQTVICSVTLPISLSLIFGIVHYEHYGVDSQKRSFFNQAISAFFISLGLNEILALVPITIRCWTGPLGHCIAIIVSIARRLFLTFASFIAIEILLYKNICIWNPTFITRLRDDFWTTFCIGWNVTFGILLSNGEWYLSDSYPPIYLFISGKDDMKISTIKQGFFVYLWIIAIILAGSFMTFRLIKNPIEEPQGSGLALNNLKHNPALVNNLQILLVITIFIVTAYPAMFVAGQGPNSFILGTLPGAVAAYLVIPISFFAFNKKLRKYVWKETKEALGLNVQVVGPAPPQNTRF